MAIDAGRLREVVVVPTNIYCTAKPVAFTFQLCKIELLFELYHISNNLFKIIERHAEEGEPLSETRDA